MRINSVQNNNKALNFKGVYMVQPDEKKVEEGLFNIESKFGFDNSNTEKLFKIINPNKNEDVLLIHHCEIAKMGWANKPALILTNDQDKDALAFLKIKNKHERRITNLYGKSSKYLKKMLTKEEITDMENISGLRFLINKRPLEYNEELIRTLTNKITRLTREKEEILYEDLFKKAKVLKSPDMAKLQAGIVNLLKTLVN